MNSDVGGHLLMVEVKAPPEVTTKELLTAEELWEMGDVGPCELVAGEMVKMTPTSRGHGRIVARLSRILGNFLEDHPLGEVQAGDVGFVVKRDPDTVRAADVMFYTAERLADVPDTGFLPIAPDLAVEVISPGDRWSEIQEKMSEYLDAGVRLTWVVDPRTRRVYIYRPGREVRRLAESDVLDGEDVLSGFTMPVGELFT
jgi:Uma2 family endonuclease